MGRPGVSDTKLQTRTSYRVQCRRLSQHTLLVCTADGAECKGLRPRRWGSAHAACHTHRGQAWEARPEDGPGSHACRCHLHSHRTEIKASGFKAMPVAGSGHSKTVAPTPPAGCGRGLHV